MEVRGQRNMSSHPDSTAECVLLQPGISKLLIHTYNPMPQKNQPRKMMKFLGYIKVNPILDKQWSLHYQGDIYTYKHIYTHAHIYITSAL